MRFNNLDEKEYKNQLKYFNSYYGSTFKKNQGTEELLNMINKYSVDGDLIDFGSGSNIYFWLLAFNQIYKVHCIDISKEAFYVNEQIKNEKLIGKSFNYPINKFHKKLSNVFKTDINYHLKDMLNGETIFNKKANNVSQFGLLGLCKNKETYFKNFKRLFASLKENGIFLGANWIFSDSYAKTKKFKNDYLNEKMINELCKSINSECLYVKKIKIEDDSNYDYVLIYTIKKHKPYTLLDVQKMRLVNNGVLNNFSNIDNCIISLIGIQSQYYNYALISLFNRVEKMHLDDILNHKDIIKSWGQRATLHLYHKKDYNTISHLYRDKPNWVKKKADKLNIKLDEYLEIIDKYMKKNKCATKSELEHILPEKQRKILMQWSGLLIQSSYNKTIYGVINDKDKKIYKLNDIKQNGIDAYSFVERYFKYYGPATILDFLHWSGLRKCDIGEDLNKFILKNNYFEVENEKYYYVIKPDIKEYRNNKYIALGKFDPLLVSYHNKKWILGDYDSGIIWNKAGQVEGVILKNGGMIGTWHYNFKNNKIVFTVKINDSIKFINYKKVENALKTIVAFLDKKEFSINYVRGDF